MPKKLICPKCSKSDYTVQNKGGSVTTFLHCKSCGYKATEKAWSIQQVDKSASAKYILSQSTSIGSDTKPASWLEDKSKSPVSPIGKKPKKNPEKAFTKEDEEEIRRVSMKNPFYKISQDVTNEVSPQMPTETINSDNMSENQSEGTQKTVEQTSYGPIEVVWENTMPLPKVINLLDNIVDQISIGGYTKLNIDGAGIYCKVLSRNEGAVTSIMITKQLNTFANINFNPFYKTSREYCDRSEHGKKMKELSDDNMTFIEDPPSKKENKKENKKEKTAQKTETNPSYDFNSVDRKEYRSSPKPWDFQPGYLDWYNREVDKYYDGWLDDHIENSGGSIPGSNNQKTMNLNEGERSHAPSFPTEAIYEKLLENRHHFDGDYTRIVANGNTYLLKKSDVESILQIANDSKKKMKKLSTSALHIVLT